MWLPPVGFEGMCIWYSIRAIWRLVLLRLKEFVAIDLRGGPVHLFIASSGEASDWGIYVSFFLLLFFIFILGPPVRIVSYILGLLDRFSGLDLK